MNKKELTNAIAERTGLSKFESRKVLNAVIEIITEEMVRNGRLLLIGFGTFSVKQKAARKGMNPSTFATIDIPAKKIDSFKRSIYLKFLLNRKKRGRKKKEEREYITIQRRYNHKQAFRICSVT